METSSRWLYLEPILATDDGELGVKFRKVDQAFKQVARIIEADPRLSVLMQSTRLQPMLDSISEQLNSCQSALNEYMDNKRTIFPRLYFLSDDDLLELLGQARAGAEGREAVMQTHLKKLFPGITGVKLGPGGLSITALCSHFGETFPLDQPVDVDCSVEVWLKNFENEIRSSLKNFTMKCLKMNGTLEQDPFSSPTQIICLVQNIRFTQQVEMAINSKELHDLKNSLEKESIYYAQTEVEDESEKYKRQALILQSDFHVLAVQSLIEGNVVTTSDWLWQKQLRFYFQDNDVVAKMALASIPYSYEYLGSQTGQFVRTTETDECFLILTQSLHLGLVGNPFGPAGTGKTESVKALGALFGRLVLVFNCDEAMDSACVGRVLRGLALSGAWGCLDEFNRLSAATLAAAAHQLAALVTDQRPLLDGKEVSVSPWCGVMVTMNPSGRGYGGRRALPSALSALLRPLALRPPDARELATRLLVARRVPAQDASVLAAALHDVFTFASSLLSDARHYDWGLRALKATVGACGAALERHKGRAALATLRDVLQLTGSKLNAYDAQRFENILSMVFAGVPEEEETNITLRSALESATKQLNLIHSDFQIQKCKELYEQMQQRIGVAIVGPPGSGKSTIRKILKTALTLLGQSVSERTVRPKAMSRAWLLGRADRDTRAWVDGVVAALAHHAAALPSDISGWMVFDGDVDPGWAEALNSLLDDNRLLALAGSRVQLPAHAHAIFETHQLDAASPATVSRLAIILLNEDNNCAPQVLESYMQTADFDDELAKMALPQLQSAIIKCLQWFNSNKSDLTFKPDHISMVHQVTAQFEYLVQNTKSSNNYTSVEDIVYLAVERSVSGVIKYNALDKFYEHVLGGIRIHNLEEDIEDGETGRLVWSPRLRRAAVSLRAMLRTTHNVLLTGPDANAKGLLLEQTLRDYHGAIVTIDCTPLLEPADILMELKRNNVLRSSEAGEGGVVAGGGDATLLVRGLHRAHTDRWGSRPVHAFLLQLCAGGAWEVGGDGPQWLRARVRLLATARSPADITPRLCAALALVIIDETDEDELLELSKIRLRENVTKNLTDEEVLQLARGIVLLYKEVTETFTSQPHYKWNSSHIESMCENIKWYSPANLQDVQMALNAEANMIFRERLVADDERVQYKLIAEKYLKCGSEVFFMPRLRSNGVYFEAMNYNEWCRNAEKLINQCITDNENVFGESGVEVSTELAALFPAIATAMRGSVAVCVSAAGGGASAAARLVCAALAATCHTPAITPAPLATRLANTFKTALSSASDGMRACVLLHAEGNDDDDLDSAAACLSHVEALVRARTAHALPSALVRAAPNANDVTLNDIKQNLGIVICINENEESLWQLFSRYPWLHRAPQWVGKWSDATLRNMPALIVQRLIKESGQEISKDDIDSIPVEGFVNIYRSLQSSSMQAPCRYVNLIRSYYHILTRKKEALVQRKNVLSAGVEALKRARIEVATLQKEASTQEAALSEEQTKANVALEQISATVRSNSDKKEEMNELKKNIEKENEQLQIRKKEIEEQLAAVEPVIAAARAAVGDIRQDALSEVRSLRAPPDAVRDVLEGVLRLMGIGDTSWHSMKNFLAKRGVKEDIRRLDAADISHDAVAAVSRLVERRANSFEDATARRASAACAPLAAWVRAQLSHAAALRHVRPLREKQQELESAVRSAESQLAALVSGVASVEERVATLTRALGEHTRAAATLELRLAAAAAALARATSLLDHLAHEYDSWERQLQEITEELAQLNLLCLLASAYIVYLAELTEQQARDVIKSWVTLMGHEDLDFSPSNFLSSPDKQFKWIADGLPSDQTALKNAVVIDQYLGDLGCGFSPLIIDPDGEAEAWLRNTLHGAPVDFVPQHSDKLKTAVQYAIRHSRVLVITEVEGCGWWCGAARTLQLSREPRRWSPRPRCAARTNVVYFAPRLHALIDQLSHYTIQTQNPSMIERYKEIKLQKVDLQKQQHELQENLLRELSQARDILHDEALSQVLQKTRATGEHIAAALAAADDIEAEVSRASAAHAPLAARAAALALATKRLQPRCPTLHLPFDCVQAQFLDSVQRYQDVENANVDEAVRYFMRTMFDRIQLSLHKKDKYIVLMHLLKQVYDDMVPDKLWKIFINHISVVDNSRVIDEIKRQHDWIGDEYLSKVAHIKMQDEDLYNRLSLDDSQVWLEYQSSGNENTIRRLNLNPFEHVLAVAALRPQSTYRAVVAFVDKVLGLSRGGSSVERAERYGTRTRPVLLLGAHAGLQLVAHAHALAHTLDTVGIEEGISAWEAALRKCQKGAWLAIMVGASPFTRDLQVFVASLAQQYVEDLSEDFRLWIITEDREVPSAIASMCVNVVLEAPEGVKHNVCGTLRAWSGSAAPRAPPPVQRHLACLALFHAVLQERRAYIPQGWSKWYEWEWGDAVAARRAVLVAGATQAARELCGALYAARADAPRDRRVLRALRRSLLDAAPHRQWVVPALPAPLPLALDLTPYLEAFNTLPETDPPELLCLPANYRLAWEKNAADNMLSGLREYDTTTNTTKMDKSTPINIILGLWKKHMSGNPLIKGDFDIEKACGAGWWRGVCAGEARDAQAAARALHRALSHLARAPQSAAIALHKVPDEWHLLWPGPESPEDYIKEFCFRARAAVERVRDCKRSEDIPKEVDVRTFLHPGRILSALRASAAERTRRASHSLALDVTWAPTAESLDGVIVVGLRLSGGEWAAGGVRPASANAAPHAPAPPLLLRYAAADDNFKDATGFSVEVYSDESRSAALWRVRAPLAPHFAPDVAELHAVALYVAPAHST